MTRKLCLCLLLAACGTEESMPLTASNVTIYAPLPGQATAVAYLTLHNERAEPLTVTNVSSPQFAAVEMHATILGDGIAQMLPLDSITVAGESDIEFATGGKHLMLIQPTESLAPGDEITVEFHYDSETALQIRAPLQMRGMGGG